MAKYDYSVIVIGGGTAGLISAYTANLLGGKVALVEGGTMGGDCLNTGCVPSKSLIASAHAMQAARMSTRFGVSSDNPVIDYAAVHARVHQVIGAIAPNDSAERYRKLGIEVYEDHAKLIDGHTVSVAGKTITARRVILTTGSRPQMPAIDGIDLAHVYSSDTIWKLTKLPKTLVVIGAGPIGCELACAYAQLGSKVTLVESGPRLLSMLAPEQSKVSEEALKQQGITLIFNGSVSRVTKKFVTINSEDISADTVLVAVGRKPNTEWLDGSGIELDNKGYIKTDGSLRTSIPTVYACGDVTGGYQFTHVAAYEASFAGSNALLDWTCIRRKPSYEAIPWVIYTTPEIAHVGMHEKDITTSHTVTHFPLGEIDRALTDGEQRGGIWLIANKNGKLVGATIIANQAASLIGEATLAIRKKLSVNDIYRTIHAYPSYGDLYNRAGGKYRLANTRQSLLRLLKRIHTTIR